MYHHATSSKSFCLILTILWTLTCRNLAPWYQQDLCFVFYATRHQTYWRLVIDDIVFACTLIWYHTHRQTEKIQGPIEIETHINIYCNHLLRAHNSYLYYSDWITCWYKNLLYEGPQCNCFSKITCRSHISANYIQQDQVLPVKHKEDRNRNGLNEQNTHTTQRRR